MKGTKLIITARDKTIEATMAKIEVMPCCYLCGNETNLIKGEMQLGSGDWEPEYFCTECTED